MSARAMSSAFPSPEDSDEYDCEETRSKFKYEVNERVLCYEPDPAKFKVLYYAKVLKIKEEPGNQDNLVQYLIHFTGWSATWDRFVSEELLLKDTEENRKLQDELKAEAEAHLQKRKRKKAVEAQQNPVEVNGGPLPQKKPKLRRKAQNGRGAPLLFFELVNDEASDDESSGYQFKANFSSDLMYKLDKDFSNVCKENKFPVLPAPITVAHVLDNFVSVRCLQKLEKWYNKFSWQQTVLVNRSAVLEDLKDELENVIHEINLWKQMAVDTHVAFETMFSQLLLYPQERVRMAKYTEACLKWQDYMPMKLEKPSILAFVIPEEIDGNEDVKEAKPGCSTAASTSTVTKLSRKYSPDICSGVIGDVRGHQPRNPAKETGAGTPKCPKDDALANEILQCMSAATEGLMQWKTVNDLYPRPSLIYGIPHLLRLITKMPAILEPLEVPKEKFYHVAEFYNNLLDFIVKEFSDDDMVYEADISLCCSATGSDD